MKNNEILWEQTLDASVTWLFMGLEITSIGFIMGMIIYNLFQMYKNGVQWDKAELLEFAEIGCYGVVYLYTKINQVFVASTLEYQIKRDAIIYRWGLKKTKEVEIPFKDITAISLVEYNSSDHSTIYLVTEGDYDIHRMNFDSNTPRHTYTLEKVKKGAEVYQLMQEQWKMAKVA